jgi:hypothetical protein
MASEAERVGQTQNSSVWRLVGAPNGAASISRFLDREAIKKTQTFKMNAHSGTAKAVPFRFQHPFDFAQDRL